MEENAYVATNYTAVSFADKVCGRDSILQKSKKVSCFDSPNSPEFYM